jgi:hypothetical protein
MPRAPFGRETLVCGFDDDEGPATVWIGVEGANLVVELVLVPGGPVGRWVAAGAAHAERHRIRIVPEMGPGGVMRVDDTGRCTSLETSVAGHLLGVRCPRWWQSAHGPSGPDEDAFAGEVDASLVVRERPPSQGSDLLQPRLG